MNRGTRPEQILLIFGPSGVGKSSFAEYLQQQHRSLWLEVDQYPRPVDGIDFHNLRRPWDTFLSSTNAADLSGELRKRIEQTGEPGCVVSFPSGVVLSPNHIKAANASSIHVVYLYGAASDCIDGFLERERKSGRNLGVDHWLLNNVKSI